MTCPASFTQVTFRGRNDNGNETTATWIATQGTDWTQAVDANFRIRFEIQEGANCGGNNKVWRMQYNLASAGWVDCSATSSVVRASASPNLADGAATTNQLTGGSGTFQGGSGTTGGFDEGDCNAGGATMDLAALGHCEPEFCVQIRSADVTDAQTLQLRVTDAGTAIASYTDTPTITVSEPLPEITGTGALSAQAADVTGAGVSSSTGTGALSSQAADVTGAGEAAWTGTGALTAQAADVTGVGTSGSTGTGALTAQASDVTGSGVSSSTGSGTLTVQAADVTGVGVTSSTGTGALIAQSADITGTWISSSSGTGALSSGSSTVSGVGTVTGGESVSGTRHMRQLHAVSANHRRKRRRAMPIHDRRINL